MIVTIKLLLALVLVAAFAIAAFVLFPRKLRLLKRVGQDKSNADLIVLAKSGDQEALALFKQSRRLLWVAIPCAMLLAGLHGLTRQ